MAVPVAAALVATKLPIAEVPSPDLRMIVLVTLAILATGLGFGLVPAWRIGRTASGGDLRHGARVFGTRGTERLRFTPSPAHTDAMIEDLAQALEALWVRCNIQRMGGHAA